MRPQWQEPCTFIDGLLAREKIWWSISAQATLRLQRYFAGEHMQQLRTHGAEVL